MNSHCGYGLYSLKSNGQINKINHNFNTVFGLKGNINHINWKPINIHVI